MTTSPSRRAITALSETPLPPGLVRALEESSAADFHDAARYDKRYAALLGQAKEFVSILDWLEVRPPHCWYVHPQLVSLIASLSAHWQSPKTTGVSFWNAIFDLTRQATCGRRLGVTSWISTRRTTHRGPHVFRAWRKCLHEQIAATRRCGSLSLQKEGGMHDSSLIIARRGPIAVYAPSDLYVLALAPPGRGKTETVKANALCWKGPALIASSKGDILQATASVRAQKGKPVWVSRLKARSVCGSAGMHPGLLDALTRVQSVAHCNQAGGGIIRSRTRWSKRRLLGGEGGRAACAAHPRSGSRQPSLLGGGRVVEDQRF